jgi:CDP-diacylglycerol--glycerol-3-phosphate 3-phosphatidyltransferase/cardiolipin synthase
MPLTSPPRRRQSHDPRRDLRLADLWTLAGLVSALRLPLAFAFPFVAHDRGLALGLYLVVGLTDFFDGRIARSRGTVSLTGATLDGWMDKVFHVNAAWSLVLFQDVPAWWLLCWFSREILQGLSIPFLLRPWLQGLTQPRHATVAGKALTWTVAAAFFGVLLDLPLLASVATPLSGLLGTATGLAYLRREWRDWRQGRSRPALGTDLAGVLNRPDPSVSPERFA